MERMSALATLLSMSAREHKVGLPPAYAYVRATPEKAGLAALIHLGNRPAIFDQCRGCAYALWASTRGAALTSKIAESEFLSGVLDPISKFPSDGDGVVRFDSFPNRLY